MRYYWLLIPCGILSFVEGKESPFSKERLEAFYDVLICEEKTLAADAGIGSSCSNTPIPPPPPPGPPPPPPPPPGPPPPPPPPPGPPPPPPPPGPPPPPPPPGPPPPPPPPGPPPPPPPPPGPPPPPPPPPAPPPPPGPSAIHGYVSYSFDNVNSNISYDDMYFVMKGLNPNSPGRTAPCFIEIDLSNGLGTCINTSASVTSSIPYTYQLSTLPMTGPSGGTAIPYVYIPPLLSNRIYICLTAGFSLPIGDAPSYGIGDPDPYDTADPNYYKLYDKVEGNIEENQLVINPTNVDYFSLPLPLSVSTNNGCTIFFAGTMPPTTPREDLFRAYLVAVDGVSATRSPASAEQWNNLILSTTAGGTTTNLRLAATVSGILPGNFQPAFFDPSYLLNDAYGLNWMDVVWSNPGNTAFYQSTGAATIYMDLSEQPGYGLWQGHVDSTGTMILTGIGGGGTAQVERQTSSYPFYSGTGFTASGDPIALPIIVRYLSMGLESGLMPLLTSSTTPLSNSYFDSLSSEYYTDNGLIPGGTTSGPWFDLYSKVVHSFGNSLYQVYTYAYDDALGYNNTITQNNIILLPASVVITLGNMSGTNINY